MQEATPTAEPVSVDVHVDPACPWCWVTALWLLEVERVRPVRLRWRLFDLAEVNRDKEDAARASGHAAGERALRVLAAARRRGGEAALARVYLEMGDAWHERAEPLGELTTLERCVTAAGLPASSAAEALDDPTTLDDVLADHREAAEAGAFGVPTLRLEGGRAWFGPIVDTRLKGEDAGALWDCVLPILRSTHVFELKRPRTGRADIGRYRVAGAASA